MAWDPQGAFAAVAAIGLRMQPWNLPKTVCFWLCACPVGVRLPWPVSGGRWHGCGRDGTGGRQLCDLPHRSLQPGDAHYRSEWGPPSEWDSGVGLTIGQSGVQGGAHHGPGRLRNQGESTSWCSCCMHVACKHAFTSLHAVLGTCNNHSQKTGHFMLHKGISSLALRSSLLSAALCGSEEQKHKYLPKLANLEWVACWVSLANDQGFAIGGRRNACYMAVFLHRLGQKWRQRWHAWEVCGGSCVSKLNMKDQPCSLEQE